MYFRAIPLADGTVVLDGTIEASLVAAWAPERVDALLAAIDALDAAVLGLEKPRGVSAAVKDALSMRAVAEAEVATRLVRDGDGYRYTASNGAAVALVVDDKGALVVAPTKESAAPAVTAESAAAPR